MNTTLIKEVSKLTLLSAAKCRMILAANQMPKIQTHLFVRHKATMRIFRQKLPKYKKSLLDLPPLTKLLTEPDGANRDTLTLGQEKIQVYKEYLPVDANTTLLEALLSSENDIDRLLRIIDVNLKTMTSFYMGVSFEAIDDMLRAKLCDTGTVIVSPEFRRLCTRALYKVRFFEADDILKLVKCLSSLRMSDDTLIVQAALNMARHMINEFNPDEVKVLTSSFDILKATKFISSGNSVENRSIKVNEN